jgi:hypothetical protein
MLNDPWHMLLCSSFFHIDSHLSDSTINFCFIHKPSMKKIVYGLFFLLLKMPLLHTALHSSRTWSTCRIRKSSCISQSSVVANARFLAAVKLSPGSRTILMRWSRNKQAITATNSTWANFSPGQFCGPSDHGKNVLCLGWTNISCANRVPKSRFASRGTSVGDGDIHREGCQRRGSDQYLGWVWTASRLGEIPVCGGITTVFWPTCSGCGDPLLHLGSARIGG